jgi:hypothetical protein
MAGMTGFEPAVSALTGQRVNQATPHPQKYQKNQLNKHIATYMRFSDFYSVESRRVLYKKWMDLSNYHGNRTVTAIRWEPLVCCISSGQPNA